MYEINKAQLGYTRQYYEPRVHVHQTVRRGGSSLVRQGSNEPPFLSATTHPLAALKARNCSTLSSPNIYLLLSGCDQPKVGVASAKNFARITPAPPFSISWIRPCVRTTKAQDSCKPSEPRPARLYRTTKNPGYAGLCIYHQSPGHTRRY